MRMTKFLTLAVLLVAIAATINALAFSTASVANGLTLNVTASQSALLAIGAPTSADLDITLTGHNSGQASISVEHGVQPGSTYTFDQVFKITNNSDHDVDLAYTLNTIAGVNITLEDQLGNSLNGLSLAAGGSADVVMEVATTAGAATGSAVTGDLIIDATRQ